MLTRRSVFAGLGVTLMGLPLTALNRLKPPQPLYHIRVTRKRLDDGTEIEKPWAYDPQGRSLGSPSLLENLVMIGEVRSFERVGTFSWVAFGPRTQTWYHWTDRDYGWNGWKVGNIYGSDPADRPVPTLDYARRLAFAHARSLRR